MTTEENGTETTGTDGPAPAGGTPGPGPGDGDGDGGRKLKIAAYLAAAAAACAVLLYTATAGRGRGAATCPPLPSVAALNTMAPDLETVFLFVPGTDNAPLSKESGAALAAAEKTLKGRGVRIACYTLPPGSPDYASFAANVPTPGIAVLTRGKGVGVVPGVASEAALMQAYATSTAEGGPLPPAVAPPGKAP